MLKLFYKERKWACDEGRIIARSACSGGRQSTKSPQKISGASMSSTWELPSVCFCYHSKSHTCGEGGHCSTDHRRTTFSDCELCRRASGSIRLERCGSCMD
ncbi:hypothetical protein KP509_02G027100 [Ceratopteris richardii]|uniref:Uncharacterized protein n=1 Tax=Ceratopteris richardii TaxID=49495 RepID=A0A8T2VB98_CERRI|nr:hypothetical protein KP509_02G027100 [Ceratopteris richardii]